MGRRYIALDADTAFNNNQPTNQAKGIAGSLGEQSFKNFNEFLHKNMTFYSHFSSN